MIVHGTDRLPVSGEHCFARLGRPRVPVVFTGAMQARISGSGTLPESSLDAESVSM